MRLPRGIRRHLRFSISLALLSPLGLAACAASVEPNDGGTNDSAGNDANNPGCPAALPTTNPNGCTPRLVCRYSGYRCYSDPYTITCECMATDGAATGTWSCGLCEGPLPPPEVA